MAVYFIKNHDTGNYKIGRAVDPRKRLSSLQTGCESELELVAVIECCDDKKIERSIHNYLSHLKLRGEWFTGNDELTRFIDILMPLNHMEKTENSWLLDVIHWCASNKMVKWVELLMSMVAGHNRHQARKEQVS